VDRRSFFATLFGGIGAALWPYPPKPIICENVEERFVPQPWGPPPRPHFVTGLSTPILNRDLCAIPRDEMWPPGETLAYRK
jgi:hypothetical protein